MSVDKRLLSKVYDMKKRVLGNAATDLNTLEHKLNEYETRRKDVMNTENIGAGLEAYRPNLYKDELYSQIANDQETLISKLPWSHGDGMQTGSVDVTIKGETDDFVLSTEPTGNAEFYAGLVANTTMATWRVSIPIKLYTQKLFVSRELVNKSTDENLLESVKQQIMSSARRTIDKLIINGDNTATSQNINTAGAAPTAGSYFLGVETSIRKEGIENGIITDTTLARSTLYKMKDVIARYASRTWDLMRVLPYRIYSKLQQFSEYSTMDAIGNLATNRNAVFNQAEGIMAYVTETFPQLTNSDAKVSATTSNNTKGSLALLYKPAVQYAFWKEMFLSITHETAEGFFIDAAIEFGSTIVNGEAGLDNSVAVAWNITL